MKPQSKAWYQKAVGTRAAWTIVKVHYDDHPPYYTWSARLSVSTGAEIETALCILESSPYTLRAR